MAKKPDPMTIDDLRTACATEGKTDDDAVLDFYCWQDAEEMADCYMDDNCEGLSELLQDYMRGRIKPVDIAEVTAWVKDYQDPDAIGGSRAELLELVARFKDTL